MFWWLYAWIVLPLGGLLAALLLTGNSLVMDLACKVLKTPVSLGNLQLSLTVVMTILSIAIMLVSFSHLRYHEGAALVDNRRASVFKAQHNIALAMLGTVVWAAAYRLKALRDQGRLVPRKARSSTIPARKRVLYIAVGILLVLAGDVPLCRLDYNLNLMLYLTPKKGQLLRRGPDVCQVVFTHGATGQCADFCNEVRALSEERLATIRHARNWHILGRVAAEFFDGVRGEEQGARRIDELFERKPCSQVLASVDKSNYFVNWACVGAVLLTFTGSLVALADAIEG